MHQDDALARNRQLAARRQRLELSVMVAAHSLDGGDGRQRVERCSRRDVARVEDQVDALQGGEHPFGKVVDELRTVRVSDDSDPGRHSGLAYPEFETYSFGRRLDKLAKPPF